jgi:hypothetical protein
MVEPTPMDSVVTVVSDEIKNAVAAACYAETGDDDTTSAETNLVTLGVDTTLAEWLSEEMVRLQVGNLTNGIEKILIRLASALSDDTIDVSSFAHKMAGKVSVKLQDDLKKRVQDGLELAKQESLNYIRDQECYILLLTSSPFYQIVGGTCEEYSLFN